MAKYKQTKGGSNTEKVFEREPATCDLCGTRDLKVFIDGKTIYGRWANMCQKCYASFGIGLGIGVGQIYIKEEME